MVVSLESRPGALNFPTPLLRAVTRRAESHAALTASCLEDVGLLSAESSQLPGAFLLELAATLQLGLWEKDDLRRRLDVDLPSYREAVDALVARCAKGPSEFAGSDAAPLSQCVLRVCIEHFAWDGPPHLQADIIVGDVNEDEFIDLLAEFVWSHRCELEHLVQRKEQE